MSGAAAPWLESLSLPGRPDEFETKDLLSRHGLRVPRGHRITPAESVEPADTALRPEFDSPFVLKVCSPEILHKTDRGGVMFSLDRQGLPAAVDDMRIRFPGCDLLVEEQLAYSGTEFILGAFRDPSFGPAMMAGAGGIFTELYQDVAFRLVPCSAREAMRMLRELKVFPVLEGFRGPAMDAAGLCEVISRVSGIVEMLGSRFDQLDINPIVYCPEGWTVLDAKLILTAGAAETGVEAIDREEGGHTLG
jgi:hypothetical protein